MKTLPRVLLHPLKIFFRTPAPLLIVSLLTGSAYLYSRFLDLAIDVKFVSLTGNISTRQKQELYAIMAAASLEHIRLDSIKAQLQSVDWIAQVNVRRRWPDHLLINIKPEVALALWNHNQFINAAGHTYRSQYQHRQHLPQLYGPSGSAIQVIDRYREISSLMFKANKSIRLLRLSDRGAWSVVDSDGIEITLGKDEITRRMRNTLLVTEQIARMGKSDKILKIDTRYANGLAIAWKSSISSIDSANGIKVVQNHHNQRAIKL